MKSAKLVSIALAFIYISSACNNVSDRNTKAGGFNMKKDLLLLHYDCKTDVDDLHSVAALVTLLSHSSFSGVEYHAVAGAYGIQEGLYVPPNDLFQLAFGDNWSDAHNNVPSAVAEVKEIVKKTLNNQGDIWIAEAGQSDFSAELTKAVQKDMPEINTTKRIHLVQHSDWNEESTSPESLEYVRKNTDYQKIPDGNAVGNGTPGFRNPEFTRWKDKIKNPELNAIWQLTADLADKYNGKEGRYNNEAIAAGGLDFSDLSEVCWILGLQDIRDAEQFFSLYSK